MKFEYLVIIVMIFLVSGILALISLDTAQTQNPIGIETDKLEYEVEPEKTIVIMTDKPRYKIYEPITVTLENVGRNSAFFPTTYPEISITNQNGTLVYKPYFIRDGHHTMEPGNKYSIEWDQLTRDIDSIRNRTYDPVPPGEYTAAISYVIDSHPSKSIDLKHKFEIYIPQEFVE